MVFAYDALDNTAPIQLLDEIDGIRPQLNSAFGILDQNPAPERVVQIPDNTFQLRQGFRPVCAGAGGAKRSGLANCLKFHEVKPRENEPAFEIIFGIKRKLPGEWAASKSL